MSATAKKTNGDGAEIVTKSVSMPAQLSEDLDAFIREQKRLGMETDFSKYARGVFRNDLKKRRKKKENAAA